jgi:hypothetical protein
MADIYEMARHLRSRVASTVDRIDVSAVEFQCARHRNSTLSELRLGAHGRAEMQWIVAEVGGDVS